MRHTKPLLATKRPHQYRTSVRSPPPLDISQRIESKIAQYNASQNVWKRWLFKIVSWVTSASCMGFVVGILLYSRDHLLSERSFALTAYNVLSKIASAALTLPISEAIGQFKWTWFHGNDSKEMIDFEIFDKASCGAWGSFLLLFRTKGQSLAALGAVLTLLLLATDTFFQQITDFPDRWALEHLGGAIPCVVRYEPFYTPEYFAGMETTFLNPAFRPVVEQFMVNNGTPSIFFGNETRPGMPLTCPSSNCTWPDYQTTGVCSKCAEVTSLRVRVYGHKRRLERNLGWVPQKPSVSEQNCNASTIGESLLVRTVPLTDMIHKTPLFGGSIKFKKLRNSIVDVLIVSTANGTGDIHRNITPVSHECVLTWCVQTLRSSYALGNYEEEIVSKVVNTTEGLWPWDAYPVKISGEGDGTITIYREDISVDVPATNASRPAVSPATYGLSNTTAAYVSQVFDYYFPSSYTALTLSDQPMLRYRNDLDGPSLRRLQFNPFLAPNNITRHMERLATALTNVVRSDVDSYEMIPGFAYNKKQFVAVTWEWLIFPIALLLLSLVFLVATVLRTSRDGHSNMGIWKTSAMPALIYSLPEDVQRDLQDPASSNDKMKKVKIRLLPDQGWRVSGHTIASPIAVQRFNHQAPPGWI